MEMRQVPTVRTLEKLLPLWIWSPGVGKSGASVNFQLISCRSKALPAASQADFIDHKDKESQQDTKIHS